MCPSRLKSFNAVRNLFLVPSGFWPAVVHLIQIHLDDLLAVHLDREAVVDRRDDARFHSPALVASLHGARQS